MTPPKLAPLNLPLIVNGDALNLPLRDSTVSLVVTSPPYWALRVYEDGGEFYAGQIGSEPDPVLFLRNLWRSMDAAWDALRDDGVAWVNLGDKYAGSGGHNNSSIVRSSPKRSKPEPPVRDAAARTEFRGAKAGEARDNVRGEIDVPAAARASRRRAAGRNGPDKRDMARAATRRNAPDRYSQGTEWARAKSLMALPWAFTLGLLNPTLYRDHLDPPNDVVCPTCQGADPAEYIDDPPCTACPTCAGDGSVVDPWPQWIYRAEQVWDKPNGLPESVDDRPRRSHEVWLMLAKNGDHYAAMDDLREPSEIVFTARQDGTVHHANAMDAAEGHHRYDVRTNHPLGKMPGSVWRIPSEPFVDVLYHLDGEHGRCLRVDELWRYVAMRMRAGDSSPVNVRMAEHFAPFPSEWPRRLVLGWSPAAICDVCDEGRIPIVEQTLVVDHEQTNTKAARLDASSGNRPTGATGYHAATRTVGSYDTTILGYVCACTPYTDNGPAGQAWGDGDDVARQGRRAKADGAQHLHKARPPRRTYHLDGWDPPPSHPSVVLDLFSGTGTTALVASALDRVGVGVDLSWDYCQLGRWRTADPKQRARARARTLANRQGTLAL